MLSFTLKIYPASRMAKWLAYSGGLSACLRISNCTLSFFLFFCGVRVQIANLSPLAKIWRYTESVCAVVSSNFCGIMTTRESSLHHIGYKILNVPFLLISFVLLTFPLAFSNQLNFMFSNFVKIF